MAPQKPLPKTLAVTFDNGSKAELPFDRLPVTLQAELLRQPFASCPSPAPESETYLVLEWKDGWREVFEVPPACTSVNRYYVITRPEDFGRLSLNTEDGYPELLEIVRDPLNLERVAFTETFSLSPLRSDREGNKTDHFFTLEKGPDLFSDLKAALQSALTEEGVSATSLKDDDGAAADLCLRLASRLNLRAGRRRQDLLDFLRYLAKED